MVHLTRLLSVANLWAAQERLRGRARLRSASGQVATFMLLGIVGVLIFVLMTANLGQMSVQATRAANAADSSALLLGSQLASQSRVLWNRMGQKTKRCVSGGLLGLLLAALAALIAIAITWCADGCITAMVVAGAVAGAVGGAVGTAITGAGGSAVLMGAIQGAMIGAALAFGVGAGLEWVAAASASTAAPGFTAMDLMIAGDLFAAEFVGVGGQLALAGSAGAGAAGAGAGAGGAPGTFGVSGAGSTVSSGITMGPVKGFLIGSSGEVSAVTLGSYASISSLGFPLTITSGLVASPALVVGTSTLSVGSSLYTASVQDQIKSDAMAKIAEALTGLPESSQFRENTIFQALIQTVDDPNKVTDIKDSDEDGDTTERVPFFQVWWAVRSGQIKSLVSELKSLTQAFITGPLTTFEAEAKAACTPTTTEVCDPGTGICTLVTTPAPLSRQEVEGTDGPVVELLRALNAAGKGVPFWTPGPSSAALDTWHEADCEACAPPPGYDEVDFAVDTFQDFVEDASTLREMVSGEVIGVNLDNVVGTWETWMKLFYDPDPGNTEDYFDLLGSLVDGGNGLVGMKGWATEIEAIRRGLPACTPQYTCDPDSGICFVSGVENPPCRGDVDAPIPAGGGSIDTDLGDEFSQVQDQLAVLIGQIETFRKAPKQFYDKMKEAEASLAADNGGANPVTYTWTDSRGDHSVQAGVGPFRLAYIKRVKSGSSLMKKICLVLKDYSTDAGAPPARVTITRQDPPMKNIGFWNWNPHGGTITKVSNVSYSFNRVGVSDIK